MPVVVVCNVFACIHVDEFMLDVVEMFISLSLSKSSSFQFSLLLAPGLAPMVLVSKLSTGPCRHYWMTLYV